MEEAEVTGWLWFLDSSKGNREVSQLEKPVFPATDWEAQQGQELRGTTCSRSDWTVYHQSGETLPQPVLQYTVR